MRVKREYPELFGATIPDKLPWVGIVDRFYDIEKKRQTKIKRLYKKYKRGIKKYSPPGPPWYEKNDLEKTADK